MADLAASSQGGNFAGSLTSADFCPCVSRARVSQPTHFAAKELALILHHGVSCLLFCLVLERSAATGSGCARQQL